MSDHDMHAVLWITNADRLRTDVERRLASVNARHPALANYDNVDLRRAVAQADLGPVNELRKDLFSAAWDTGRASADIAYRAAANRAYSAANPTPKGFWGKLRETVMTDRARQRRTDRAIAGLVREVRELRPETNAVIDSLTGGNGDGSIDEVVTTGHNVAFARRIELLAQAHQAHDPRLRGTAATLADIAGRVPLPEHGLGPRTFVTSHLPRRVAGLANADRLANMAAAAAALLGERDGAVRDALRDHARTVGNVRYGHERTAWTDCPPDVVDQHWGSVPVYAVGDRVAGISGAGGSQADRVLEAVSVAASHGATERASELSASLT